jgi:hypothetical protein
MHQTLTTAITVIGIDIGKNSSHIVGLDQRGLIARGAHVSLRLWLETGR